MQLLNLANSSTNESVFTGVWDGESPLGFSLSLLIIQIWLVILTTRLLAFLMRPLRQPRVVAEIIGGVLLGPSALGHSKSYTSKFFPHESLSTLDTFSVMGLMLYLFMVGLELDLQGIRRSARKCMAIAAAGMVVPFAAAAAASILLHHTICRQSKLPALIIFVGIPLSITAFAVLIRILGELKLLDTEIGELVIPAAAINDLTVWIILPLGVALADPRAKPLSLLWVAMSGMGFVVLMLGVVTRFMVWVAHQATSNQDHVIAEICVSFTLAGVLLAGLITDTIGVHPFFGAFVFGLSIPKQGGFAEMMVEKIHGLVTAIMLPLFFASSGLKADLSAMAKTRSLAFLVGLMVIQVTGKISSTFVAALASNMDTRKSLVIGFLMNTKGLVELIVLNIGKDLKVLNDEIFGILLVICLLATFITTPAVIALYKPLREATPI